ncbi:hypothetical protein B0H13DRAFT_1862877 [Mycena leptocephala]|nr:hypothetical protein B0H13DRAFT_1862877 [Mycena leptocephala]
MWRTLSLRDISTTLPTQFIIHEIRVMGAHEEDGKGGVGNGQMFEMWLQAKFAVTGVAVKPALEEVGLGQGHVVRLHRILKLLTQSLKEDAIKHANDFIASGDGTGHKHHNYESRFITVKEKLLALGLTQAPNHTSLKFDWWALILGRWIVLMPSYRPDRGQKQQLQNDPSFKQIHAAVPDISAFYCLRAQKRAFATSRNFHILKCLKPLALVAYFAFCAPGIDAIKENCTQKNLLTLFSPPDISGSQQALPPDRKRPQRDSNPRLLDIIRPDWIKGCDHRTVWVAACSKGILDTRGNMSEEMNGEIQRKGAEIGAAVRVKACSPSVVHTALNLGEEVLALAAVREVGKEKKHEPN